MTRKLIHVAVLALAALCILPRQANAQGCVAARSPQTNIDALCDTGDHSAMPTGKGFNIHNLTLNIAFREFTSFRHFIGTDEQVQREILHTQIKNHQDFWDVGVSYRLSPRWTLLADVPFSVSSRNQLYPPKGIYHVSGIGDMILGAQSWIFRPPTENNGNIAIGAALKLPTGINNATGTATFANGQVGKATADQSLQPGDGTWGFGLNTQAYKQVYFHTMTYFAGSWLFNPVNTTGVKTFRARPTEAVMSASDQYLWRGGLSHSVPKVRGLALSIGGRMEGVPVRDAFGKSDGFRRPGYIISVEPGLMYERRKTMVTVYGPWAVERNRKRSTSDIATGPKTHGDAAFADYTVLVGVSKRF
jgi:hypothetical protein